MAVFFGSYGIGTANPIRTVQLYIGRIIVIRIEMFFSIPLAVSVGLLLGA